MNFVTKSTDDFSESFLDFVRLDSQLVRPRTLAAAGRFKFPANGRHTKTAKLHGILSQFAGHVIGVLPYCTATVDVWMVVSSERVSNFPVVFS